MYRITRQNVMLHYGRTEIRVENFRDEFPTPINATL